MNLNLGTLKIHPPAHGAWGRVAASHATEDTHRC